MAPSMTPSDRPKKRSWMRIALIVGGSLIGLCLLCGIIGALAGDPAPQTASAPTATQADIPAASPTVAVEPSPSPMASEAPTLEPSPNAEPTLVPTVEPTLESPEGATLAGSIGVSRASVQAVYERSAVGFTFEESTPVDGQPRVSGKSRNGLAIMELIGPEEELTKATIIVGVPNNNQQAVTENAVYLLGLLKVTSPEWTEGTTWVTENLSEAASSDEPITTIQGKQQISLQGYKELGFVSLAVEPAP
jgi:hypothetical protein